MKEIIFSIFLCFFSVIGYLLYEWKGFLLFTFTFIFISASFFSEVFFWKDKRKNGKKDITDLLIDKLKKVK